MGLPKILFGIIISLGCGLGVLSVIAILLFGKLPEKDVVLAVTSFVWNGSGLAMGITAIISGMWQKKTRESEQITYVNNFRFIRIYDFYRRYFFVVKSLES